MPTKSEFNDQNISNQKSDLLGATSITPGFNPVVIDKPTNKARGGMLPKPQISDEGQWMNGD